MQQIDAGNAESYLRAKGWVPPGEMMRVRELAGGVSNVVLLVSHADGQPWFVLKQARPQLRVAEPWFCSVERIWREVEVIEFCGRALGRSSITIGTADDFAVAVPSVLLQDRSNYLFAMTAAPEHRVLKDLLLAGDCNHAAVRDCGELLGRLHAATWQDPEIAERLADRDFFVQLRIDPYYRHMARNHIELAPALDALIHSLEFHPRCLVHGDFSPKNILIYPGGLMLVDFEVGHFGDPAFDLGFFLTHLVLKSIHFGERWPEYIELTNTFWQAYWHALERVVAPAEMNDLERRAIWNFVGCLLARVDGKSKIDYLSQTNRDRVRRVGRKLLGDLPKDWQQTVKVLGANE